MRPILHILGPVAVLAACSSSQSSPAPTTTPSPSDAGLAEAAAPIDGGATDAGGGRDDDGAVPANDWTTCTTSDALPAAVDRTRLAVAQAGTSTGIYVAIDAVQFEGEPAIRRYTLQASPGCTLVRDVTFGAAGELRKPLGPSLEADSTGGVWTLDDPTIARIHPTALSCTLQGDLSGEFAHRFAIDPTGANGFVQFETGANLLAKLTNTTACAISPMTLTGAPAGSRSAVGDLAVDSTGRLHVIWGGFGPPPEVEVYEANGAFVKSYVPDASHPSIRQVATCGTGMCIVSSNGTERTLSRCNADGAACVTRTTPFATSDEAYLAASPGARSFFLRVVGSGASAKAEIVAGP